MNICIDRPRDRLITERIEMLSGWVESEAGDCDLTAVCGSEEVTLRKFLYPPADSKTRQGFWGYLVLQNLLPFAKNQFLSIDLFFDRRLLNILHLRISPMANELARNYPLNLKTYWTDAQRAPFGSQEPPHTLVFPGLGAVGGSTLNQLMRMKMLREGWPLPVYGEANDPDLWSRVCAAHHPAYRWIDGHYCYGAASFLDNSFARITLLREPVRRLISAFNFSLVAAPFQFPHSTFEEFVFSDEVRQFSQAFGILRSAGLKVPTMIRDEELYALANTELKRNYALIGITEFFEETIFLICSLAGYSNIGMWWRTLSAPRSIQLQELSNRIRKRVETVLAVDIRLYEERKQEFLRLLQRANFGPALVEYKTDAAQQSELPDIYKMAECLRWRQIITEEQLFRLRHTLSRAEPAIAGE